jgi:hypothetical protein
LSKVDAQRAMREARNADPAISRPASPVSRPPARSATARAEPVIARPAASAAARETAPETAPIAKPAALESTAVCGHRSIGGKSCQRPAGHAEQNHRYK